MPIQLCKAPAAGAPTNPTAPMAYESYLSRYSGVTTGTAPPIQMFAPAVLSQPNGGVWMTQQTAVNGFGDVHFNFNISDINALMPDGESKLFRASSAGIEIHVGSSPLLRLSAHKLYDDLVTLDPTAPASIEAVGCIDLNIGQVLPRPVWTLVIRARGFWGSLDSKGLFGSPGPASLLINLVMPLTVKPSPFSVP
jgi:hypothetical protein